MTVGERRAPARAGWAAYLALAVAGSIVPPAEMAHAETPIVETPAERIADILGQAGYQRELPGAPPEPERVAPPEPRRQVPVEVEPPDDRSLLQPLLIMLAIVGAALLVLHLVLQLRGRGGMAAVRAGDAAPDPAAGSGEPVGPLADADRIAASGAWAEAIHLLLLHGLDDLRRRLGQPVPPALTSRELMRRIALPERATAALGAIVAAVERSHFGAQPVGPDDYRSCRAHYRDLLDYARPVDAPRGSPP